MKGFLKSIDSLPLLIKLIFCIPAVHFVWGIYRIVSALEAGNLTALVIHIILFFLEPVMCVVDFIMILLTGSALKLA